MRTIGLYLKEAREAKKLSRYQVERETKIKREFIVAIENEQWKLLPDFPVVVGFVKSIAAFLGINPASAIALLRRDYPPKNISISPKPDVSDNFIWGPKLTFGLVIGLFILAIGGYLVFQYVRFVTPPGLSVVQPSENQLVTEKTVEVLGTTDPEATVKVNNQPVLIDKSGNFAIAIEIFEGTTEIKVVAQSRTGKETAVTRKIRVELK